MYSLLPVYLRHLILARRRTFLEKVLLLIARLFAPEETRLAWNPLGEILSSRRVAVLAYSDSDLNLSRQFVWGDYWFKHELTKAIGSANFVVVEPHYRPDIVVHLFGEPVDLSSFSSAQKILWIHSNPNKIDARILENYDRVCCCSEVFAAKIRGMGFECDYVQQGTSKQPISAFSRQHDVVFVGNARAGLEGSRPVVTAIGEPTYDFRVWGTGYRSLPAQYWAGEYFDYYALGQLYASSCITLNDHQPAMSAAGFINPRVFDVLAAGGFCISDTNEAITALFGESVPQYQSAEHLRELVEYYLTHPDERNALARQGHDIAVQFSWDRVARSLLRDISPLYDQ